MVKISEMSIASVNDSGILENNLDLKLFIYFQLKEINMSK